MGCKDISGKHTGSISELCRELLIADSDPNDPEKLPLHGYIAKSRLSLL